MTDNIYIKIPPFNSLVWGSLKLAPIILHPTHKSLGNKAVCLHECVCAHVRACVYVCVCIMAYGSTP